MVRRRGGPEGSGSPNTFVHRASVVECGSPSAALASGILHGHLLVLSPLSDPKAPEGTGALQSFAGRGAWLRAPASWSAAVLLPLWIRGAPGPLERSGLFSRAVDVESKSARRTGALQKLR